MFCVMHQIFLPSSPRVCYFFIAFYDVDVIAVDFFLSVANTHSKVIISVEFEVEAGKKLQTNSVINLCGEVKIYKILQMNKS